MCKQLTNLNSAFDFFRFEAQFKEPSRLFWPFSCDHFGSKRRVSIGTIEDKSKERERESSHFGSRCLRRLLHRPRPRSLKRGEWGEGTLLCRAPLIPTPLRRKPKIA